MAELGKVENVIVGAASIYLGPANVAKPAFEVTDAAAVPPTVAKSYRDTLDDEVLGAGWVNPGFTQEGLEVSYEPDYGDVEVDQMLDSAVVFKQSMRVSLNTTLAEATLRNIMLAWGQADTSLTFPDGDTNEEEGELVIDGGSLGEAPYERGFIAVGNSPRAGGKYGERVYHAFRTLNVESSTHSMRRNENTGIPVSFRALPNDVGLYGSIKDRKRTW